MSDTVQQIKDKLSIQDVVSSYVKLSRAGSSLRARCPFHAERTPSFHVSPERGTYHCFGCGVGGDIFSFVQAIEGIDFKGALKILAERAGVPLVYARGKAHEKDDRDRLYELLEVATIFYMSKLDDAAKAYLEKRGISKSTLQAFRVGLAGDAWEDATTYLRKKKFTEKEILDAGIAKRSERGGILDKFRNRIMFPISDSAGRVVGFSGRIFGEHASPDAPKYLNSPETVLFRKSHILYGFDIAKQAIRKHNFAVLVEGQMDLLASHQAGWGNTVAVSGTAFTTEHAALLKRMSENLLLALDADEAGIKAAGRAARAALAQGLNVKVAALPAELDPADLILKKGTDAWKAAIREAKDIITFLLDVLEVRTKTPDRFRRAVETIVLPFLSNVQSPIAREQYVVQISRRLGVSEGAVGEALSRLPREPVLPSQAGKGMSVVQDTGHVRSTTESSRLSERVRQALSVLLWQRSLEKPLIDLASFTKEFERAVGSDMFKELHLLAEAEHEALRFTSQRLYASSVSLERETNTLLQVILRERLAMELAEASSSLKMAEVRGDEAAVEEFMSRCKSLTEEIARL